MTESRFPVTTLEFEISFLQGSFTVLVKLSFWWTVPPLLRFDVCLTSFLFLFCISFCCLYYILYVLFCQHFFIIIFIFFHYKILFYKLYETFQSFYFIHRIVDKYPVRLHRRTQTGRVLRSVVDFYVITECISKQMLLPAHTSECWYLSSLRCQSARS